MRHRLGGGAPDCLRKMTMSFNIGEAAKTSGISAKMIRYYEEIGLISRIARSESGDRVHPQSDVRTLAGIRRARDLGFLVEDIAGLLDLWRNRERASGEVKDLVLHHIAGLRSRIESLESMCRTLERLACDCPGDQRPDCPILDDLAEGEMHEGPLPRLRSPGGMLAKKAPQSAGRL